MNPTKLFLLFQIHTYGSHSNVGVFLSKEDIVGFFKNQEANERCPKLCDYKIDIERNVIEVRIHNYTHDPEYYRRQDQTYYIKEIDFYDKPIKYQQELFV